MNNHLCCVQTVGSLNSEKWMNTAELLTRTCPHPALPFIFFSFVLVLKTNKQKREKKFINRNCNILQFLSRVSGQPLKSKRL